MKRLFILTIILSLSLNLVSDEKAVKFGKAIENYLKGEYLKAIPLVKEILKEEPENKKAKDLYFKSLKKLAIENEKQKKYEAAYNYAKKALEIKEDKYLRDMLIRLEGILKEKKEKKLKKPAKKQKKKKVEKKREISKKKEEKQKVVVGEKKETKKRQEKVSPKKEKKEVVKRKKASVTLSPIFYVIISLNFIGIVFLAYLFISQSPKREEERLLLQERRISQLVDSLSREEEYDAILKQQKKIIEMLEKIPRAENTIKSQSEKLIKLIENLTKGQKTIKIELPPGSGREVLTDVNPLPRIRADAVELIGEMFDDPVIVEEMLEPYLSDENNRVLGNACKVLFKYNRRRSLSILKDMMNSSDKWMRASAAWALGEIGDPEAINYLKILLNDNERNVRIRAVKSFWNLKKKGIQIPREIELKIQEIEKEENLKRE